METWKQNPTDPHGNVAYGNLMKEEFISFARDLDQPIFIDRVGITHPDPEYMVYRKTNNILVIEYVISGKGYLEIDGTLSKVGAGDIYIITPEVSCKYWADKEQPFKKIWVNLFSDIFVSLLHKLKLDEKNVYHQNPPEIYELFLALINKADKDHDLPSIHLELSVIIYEILTRLSTVQNIKLQEENLAHRAYSKLNSKVYSNVKIKEIAEELFVSKNYLIEEFKKEYGITPLQHLNTKRIEVIKNLLENTDMSISALAKQLNFNNEYYLSTFFKSKIGVTPTQYRRCFKK